MGQVHSRKKIQLAFLFSSKALTDKHPEKGSKVRLAPAVIDYMTRAQTESATTMAFRILGSRYFQVNPEVADDEFELNRLSHNLMSLADAQWRRAQFGLGPTRISGSSGRSAQASLRLNL